MPKNAVQYCYEKVAPPTSSSYYSLRKIPTEKRDVIVAIHAFYREIEEVIFECQEPELALVKLNWWRTEIAKSSNHPVLIILQSQLPNLQRLEKIIDGFQQIIIPTPFATFEDVVIQWMRTAGERELLINEVINPGEGVLNDIIYQLMLVIEMVNYMQHLHEYVRHHIIYFSTDEMERFGVMQDTLSEYITTEAIHHLLHYQVEKIERAYAIINSLSRQQQMRLQYLLIRCEIARATLTAIQESNFKVLENWIKLTPFRYAWIVFKSLF